MEIAYKTSYFVVTSLTRTTTFPDLILAFLALFISFAMARPVYQGVEINESTPRPLEQLLENVHVSIYSSFCDRVLAAQASFVNDPGTPRLGLYKDNLLQVPLMDTLTVANYKGKLESIYAGALFLYLYVPKNVARACLEQQSLAPIPERLRLRAGGQLAIVRDPFDQITANEIVETYNRYGCSNATREDVEFFMAVPHTSEFNAPHDDRRVKIRRAVFGRFDIAVIGPALYH
ncbi:hypothetical protein ACVIRO_007161 [Rhizobium ruizarguesonis]|nr:hypothetical protein G7039_36750 [Rhizobium leguminosarum]